MSQAELLADMVDGSRAWTLKLIADLEGKDWTFQPRPGVQHALWLCGHLAVAEGLLVLERCLGHTGVSPEFAGHFRIGGPIPSASEHAYPSPDVVRSMMDETHVRVLSAIRRMDDHLLAEPCPGMGGAAHPHYRTKAGAVVHCARHEGFHAGQLAMLRRLVGKSFLR